MSNPFLRKIPLESFMSDKGFLTKKEELKSQEVIQTIYNSSPKIQVFLQGKPQSGKSWTSILTALRGLSDNKFDVAWVVSSLDRLDYKQDYESKVNEVKIKRVAGSENLKFGIVRYSLDDILFDIQSEKRVLIVNDEGGWYGIQQESSYCELFKIAQESNSTRIVVVGATNIAVQVNSNIEYITVHLGHNRGAHYYGVANFLKKYQSNSKYFLDARFNTFEDTIQHCYDVYGNLPTDRLGVWRTNANRRDLTSEVDYCIKNNIRWVFAGDSSGDTIDSDIFNQGLENIGLNPTTQSNWSAKQIMDEAFSEANQNRGFIVVFILRSFVAGTDWGDNKGTVLFIRDNQRAISQQIQGICRIANHASEKNDNGDYQLHQPLYDHLEKQLVICDPRFLGFQNDLDSGFDIYKDNLLQKWGISEDESLATGVTPDITTYGVESVSLAKRFENLSIENQRGTISTLIEKYGFYDESDTVNARLERLLQTGDSRIGKSKGRVSISNNSDKLNYHEVNKREYLGETLYKMDAYREADPNIIIIVDGKTNLCDLYIKVQQSVDVDTSKTKSGKNTTVYSMEFA